MTSSYVAAKQAGRSRAGVGLGLRWDFLDEVLEANALDVAFWEVSPENYMRRGGYFPAALERLGDSYPLVTHGLTMSVGAQQPPDDAYLADLRGELARTRSPWHSDHLCLSTAGPLILHELLPLPLQRKYVTRAADRIRWLEDRLGCPFLVENISYYVQPGPAELSELEFLCAVLEKADCGLLLDVNNVYVNARNHGYDAADFIRQLPLERVVQIHVAGHLRLEAPHPAAGLLLDTHGAPVLPSVQELLQSTLRSVGPVPVLLERDNEIPPLSDLMDEVRALRRIYESALENAS